MNNIVIVAHKYLTQPDDELIRYLNEMKKRNVLHIYHSFIEAPDRKSYAIWYKNGKQFQKFESRDFKRFPEPIIYIKEMVYTLFWIFSTNIIWDAYIGMDGLCVGFGNILKYFARVKKTIFWAIDFVPERRFSSRMKNWVYHIININGYKNSDEMWDLSPRMADAREKYLGFKKTIYNTQKVVPYGMWTDKIAKYSYDKCEKNTLVFMGYLTEKQGVQLVIKAIPEIIQSSPAFHFKIIGDGNYRKDLMRLASQLGVSKYCDFKGKIDNIKELENEVAKSAVAIAPYIKRLDTWTYYADPGKVKTYLGCGVPVLLTDLPWNAEDIERNKCGKIIGESVADIVEGITEFMEPQINQKYRKNAQIYAKRFNYSKIFDDLNL